jgi:transcriptional regulator with XRE-family HTH domain
MNFGELVRQYRKQRKLTLRQVYKLTGTPYSYIAKIERDNTKVGLTVAIRLAKAFELSDDEYMIFVGSLGIGEYKVRSTMEGAVPKPVSEVVDTVTEQYHIETQDILEVVWRKGACHLHPDVSIILRDRRIIRVESRIIEEAL